MSFCENWSCLVIDHIINKIREYMPQIYDILNLKIMSFFFIYTVLLVCYSHLSADVNYILSQTKFIVQYLLNVWWYMLVMFLHRKRFGGNVILSFTFCELVILCLELLFVKDASIELHEISVSVIKEYVEDLVRGTFVHKYFQLEKFTQNLL